MELPQWEDLPLAIPPAPPQTLKGGPKSQRFPGFLLGSSPRTLDMYRMS